VVVAGAGDCLRCFAALIWRDPMLVSLEGSAVEFLSGSGWSGAHWEPDRAVWQVQQESTATGVDLPGRARTS